MSKTRRADAERSRVAILDAAAHLVGERPDANVEAIAMAAGVTRQTVYAHYPSREQLLAAVVERVTGEMVAAMDATDPDDGPAQDALLRMLDASTRVAERYLGLLDAAPASMRDDEQRHSPVAERLMRVIVRGQRSGEFDDQPTAAWLVAAVISLGHAAGYQVRAGRMSNVEATAAFRTSVVRIVQP